MSDQPLVSVIINCFNGEKYIQKAIDSVISQTYKNWEIIFFDNIKNILLHGQKLTPLQFVSIGMDMVVY